MSYLNEKIARRAFIGSLLAFNSCIYPIFAKTEEDKPKTDSFVDGLSDEFIELWKENSERLVDWKFRTTARKEDPKTIEMLYYTNRNGIMFFSIAQLPEDSLKIEVYSRPFKKEDGEMDTFEIIRKTERNKPVFYLNITDPNDDAKFIVRLQRVFFDIYSPMNPNVRTVDFLKKQIKEMEEWEKKNGVNQKTSENYSELSLACALGDVKAVQSFIVTRKSVDILEEDSLTPLLITLLPKNSDKLREIIKNYVIKNAKESLSPEEIEKKVQSKIILHQKNRKSILKKLMETKTPPNLTLSLPEEGTAYHLALSLVFTGEDKEGSIFLNLLEKTIYQQDAQNPFDIQDKNGNTPYHLAAIAARTKPLNEPLQKLMDAKVGTGFFLENNKGLDVLSILVANGNQEMIDYWVDNCYPVELYHSEENGEIVAKTALMRIAEEPSDIKLLMGEKLISGMNFPVNYPSVFNDFGKNFYLNIQDESGFTALHYAVKKGSLEVIDMLLKKRTSERAEWSKEYPICADVNIQDNAGKTPLQWAVALGRQEIVEKLLSCEDIEPNVMDEKILLDRTSGSNQPYYLVDPVLRIRSQLDEGFCRKNLLFSEKELPEIQPKKGRSALYYALDWAAKEKKEGKKGTELGVRTSILLLLIKSDKVTTDVCEDGKTAFQVVQEWQDSKKFSLEICKELTQILNTKVPFNPRPIEIKQEEDKFEKQFLEMATRYNEGYGKIENHPRLVADQIGTTPVPKQETQTSY